MLHKRKRSASPVFQNTPLIKQTILTRIIPNNERARARSPPPKRGENHEGTGTHHSLVLNVLDLASAYATWCAAGIVATSAISVLVFGDHLSPMMLVGLGLCVAGVVIVNLASAS